MHAKETYSKTHGNPDSQSRDLGDEERPDAHLDAITGAPGSHPIGVGVGAAGGGVAGAFAGVVIGSAVPIVGNILGGALGAAIGAIGGGYAGKEVAESVNPTEEEAFWRDNYKARPYYSDDDDYETYHSAYQYGWESRSNYPDRSFDEVESDLSSGWDEAKGESTLDWDRARHATHDAWNRVDEKFTGRNDTVRSDRNPL